jgi:hypothetical protein
MFNNRLLILRNAAAKLYNSNKLVKIFCCSAELLILQN